MTPPPSNAPFISENDPTQNKQDFENDPPA